MTSVDPAVVCPRADLRRDVRDLRASRVRAVRRPSRAWARAGALAGASALGVAVSVAGAAPANAVVETPQKFTSAFTVTATPDNVLDSSGLPVEGESGASGSATLRVNSDLDIICWDVTVRGVSGTVAGAGLSGMAIREAPAGYTGPARIAVPNPEGNAAKRTGAGCAQGPFKTGVVGEDGRDTAAFFSLADLEKNPSAYAWDLETTAFPAGAIRGQLVRVPVGGLHTGFGGMQDQGSSVVGTVGGVTSALFALGAGVMMLRRPRPQE